MLCSRGPVRNSFLLAAAAFLLISSMSCSSRTEAEQVAQSTTGGSAARGATAITRYGCGSCHIIPGISGAHGLAGPPLSGIASRIYIAGVLQNTPPNMMRWIEDPPGIDEHTVMPKLGVTHQDAADIAGYLYTLK
jgi:cytochrome c